MPRRLHLVRHGEVLNPDRVLYGRLPGFGLSERGERMAERTAAHLQGLKRPISALYASPLQRTQESAAPIAKRLGHEVQLDERLIEGDNVFEGGRMRGPGGQLRQPRNWPKLRNPFRPSWGEPYASIAARMSAVMNDVADRAETAGDEADIVLVSHQLPIWMAHRVSRREPLFHLPSRRRCALSSVTSFERHGGHWVEVTYADPAKALATGAIDVGAV